MISMKCRGRFCSYLKGNKGSTAVIMICVTLIIILAAALLTDVGYAAIERFKLKQNAQSVANEGAEILVSSRDKAFEYMKLSAVRKVNDLNALDIRISDNNREITVTMGKPFKYIFLGILGFSSKQIKTNITVKLSSIDSYKGSRPFVIAKQNFNFGSSVTLSDDPTQKLDFIKIYPVNEGSGSFKTDIIYGNRKLLKVGEKVNLLKNYNISDVEESLASLIKKCNHQPVCTYDRYVGGCSRIIVLPVIDKENPLNGSPVSIKGFTSFFVESCSVNNNYVRISGKFIRYIVKSNTNDGVEDFGLLGIRTIS